MRSEAYCVPHSSPGVRGWLRHLATDRARSRVVQCPSRCCSSRWLSGCQCRPNLGASVRRIGEQRWRTSPRSPGR